MWTKIAVLVPCVFFLCTQSASAVNIDLVTVGNPGNAPDVWLNGTQIGSVNYVYQIGKYEITAGQYADFLNAVAKDDANGPYSTAYATQGPHIQQSGSSPNFSYSVAPDWAYRPMDVLLLGDAARFCNWLHNGQPTGPQGPGTTEDGAYAITDSTTISARKPGAKYFIPSNDEWYKAAYHDQAAGVAAHYFDYPTGTNTPPGNDITELTNPGNNANCYTIMNSQINYAIGSPYFRTVVGEFELSPSPYGTFDQGGNVWEFNESMIGQQVGFLYGGSYRSLISRWKRTDAYGKVVFIPALDAGFRVAAAAPIPEPPNIALYSLAAVMLDVRRYRTRRR